MLNPNRIANMSSGMKETIGISPSIPSRLEPHCHWKIATTTP